MKQAQCVYNGHGRKFAAVLCAVALAAALQAGVTCLFEGATMKV